MPITLIIIVTMNCVYSILGSSNANGWRGRDSHETNGKGNVRRCLSIFALPRRLILASCLRAGLLCFMEVWPRREFPSYQIVLKSGFLWQKNLM